MAPLRGHHLLLVAVGHPLVGRVDQDLAHARGIPEPAARRRGYPLLRQPLRDAVQRAPLLDMPGEDALHYARLTGLHPHPCWVPRATRVDPIAVRWGVHGSSFPLRRAASRPRRLRSAMTVRSYSATAPRI